MVEKRHKNTRKRANIDNPYLNTYNPIWIDEYKMMREELVNYMDKLQSVRNMMYLAIGTIFTFSISDKLPIFCILLPLLLIVPAYATAVNYWICVRKASAYLVIFHESYKDCPIHWESRHNMLKNMGNRKAVFEKSTLRNIPYQLLAYYGCAAITMIVYVFQLCRCVDELSEEVPTFWNISIDDIPILVYIITGIIITILLFVFFIVFSKGESYDSFLKKFLLIKNREEQSEIGKRCPDGIFDEKDIQYSQKFLDYK